jgi:hypothetical protein
MVKPSLVLLSVMQGHLVGQPQPRPVEEVPVVGEQADERVGGPVTLVGDSRHDPVGDGPQAHPDRGLAVADPVGHGLAYRACQVVDLDAAEVGGSGDVEHAAAG